MAKPLAIGCQKQLFLDDLVVGRLEGVRRTLHRPVKVPECPVVVVDQPWEQGAPPPHNDNDMVRLDQTSGQAFKKDVEHKFVTYNGTVIDDAEDGYLKMWYEAYPGLVCYAVSSDGVTWEKPTLNAVEWGGSRRNNIVLNTGRRGGTTISVIKDERDLDPMRRYKAMYGAAPIPLVPGRPEPSVHGACVAFSPDGIHWTPHPNNPVWPFRPLGPNDSLRTIYDPYKGRFACYDKIHREVGGRWRRVVGLGYSDDFVNWSNPEPTLMPDEHDPYDDDFYGLCVSAYEGIYLGYLWVFHTNPESAMAGKVRMDGFTDVQLATSRDGVHWSRVAGRQLFIPLGPPGTYEAGQLATATHARLIVRNDEIYVYYSGLGGRLVITTSGLNVGKLRLDGFVSLDGGPGGVFETAPLVAGGQRLVVNADARAGRLAVEVCGLDGQPLPGLSRADSDVFHGDGLRQTITWGGDANLALGDQPIRLRFYLDDASLYSFRFAP